MNKNNSSEPTTRHTKMQRLVFLAMFAITFQAGAGESWFNKVPLAEALDKLSGIAGVPIVYSSDTVHPAMRVPPPGPNAELESTLDAWLSNWHLTYRRVHDVVVIQHAQRRHSNEFLVAGVVRNAESGEPVAGIAIRTTGGEASSESDRNGRFLLSLNRAGEVTLQIASRGWRLARSAMAQPDASGIQFVELAVSEIAYQLDRVEVTPSFYQLDSPPTDAGHHFSHAVIEAAPKLGGEVLRSVGNLPGVMQDGVSARAHLRGGVASETLYLFDGIRLYDPFHLREFMAPFSFLDAQRIESATVRLSAYPVHSGNRLSGVIAFDSIEPLARFGGEVDVSAFDTGVMISDTFSNGGTGWLVSARRGHLDLLVDVFNADVGSPSYSDYYATLQHEMTSGLQLSASFLGARDRVIANAPDHEQEARADYDDRYYWLRAAWSPSERVDISVTATNTLLNSLRTGMANHPDEFTGTVSDRSEAEIHGISVDVIWRALPSLRIRTGAGFEWRDAEYEYRATRTLLGPLGAMAGNSSFDRDFDGAFSGEAQHAYVETRKQFGKHFFAELGMRLDRQSYPADGDTQFSPRLGLAWEFHDDVALRFSAGRYWQAMGIEELPVKDGVTNYYRPEYSDNIVAGLDWRIRRNLTLRTELFENRTHRPWPRFENILDRRSLVAELESDRVVFAPASAKTRGIETTIAYQNADSDAGWWLTLAALRATDRINGRGVPRTWEQRWRADVGVRWAWGNWMFASTLRASAGRPATPLRLDPDGPTTVVIAAPVNADSLPMMHGLDLRVSRAWRSGSNDYTFYLEVSNVYTGPNACCVDYALTRGDDGSPVLRRKIEDWYGVVSNLGFRWRFR